MVSSCIISYLWITTIILHHTFYSVNMWCKTIFLSIRQFAGSQFYVGNEILCNNPAFTLRHKTHRFPTPMHPAQLTIKLLSKHMWSLWYTGSLWNNTHTYQHEHDHGIWQPLLTFYQPNKKLIHVNCHNLAAPDTIFPPPSYMVMVLSSSCNLMKSY